MKVCVIGATGGVGRAVVEHAIAAGHSVSALVRDPSRLPVAGDVTTVVGELTDVEALARALDGCDGVVWAVGAASNSPDQPAIFEAAAKLLVEQMQRRGVRRLVAVSGAGISVAGESKPLADRLVSTFVRMVVPNVVEAKQREYAVFAASDLDWTLVRPPRVVEGAATGRLLAGERLRGRTVSQGDLARFMVDQLGDASYLRAAPYISSG